MPVSPHFAAIQSDYIVLGFDVWLSCYQVFAVTTDMFLLLCCSRVSVTFDAAKCEEMMAQGKRNLLCGEVTTAVNQLQEVCQLLYVFNSDLSLPSVLYVTVLSLGNFLLYCRLFILLIIIVVPLFLVSLCCGLCLCVRERALTLFS